MKYLITGGAGFIGSNLAHTLLKRADEVIIFDNFSRNGSKANKAWLQQMEGVHLKIVAGDIRDDYKKLVPFVKNVDVIVHLAGQVAVTTSVENPLEDFEINARGTLNLLEAVRASGNNPIFLYSSTNKVYGELEDVKIMETSSRYAFVNMKSGVSEERNLDFHSPYGSSKGTADQYVRDYARIYGLRTIVFRQSCIYGPRQFGVEDQGWVAWFIIALTMGKNITIYGNGKQVRDLLHVNDLINAYDLAIKNIEKTKGQIYNIGGGSKNTISIWHEFKPILEGLFKKKIHVKFADFRQGDQPIFVSNIKKAEKELIPDGSNIIFATGWGTHWSKPDFLTHDWFMKKDAVEYIVAKKICC